MGLEKGRYSQSPPVIYSIPAGTANETIRKTFDRTLNYTFGKYGFPNEIQIRNFSNNKLTLLINDEYEYRIPPSIIENFEFDEEEIKNFSIKNLETFVTDDLIQITVKKSVTSSMIYTKIFEWIDNRSGRGAY
ncbi:MAG: hypothetical protein LBU81_02785 [Methanosarcinales archaeon]|nr:hypothetical protein [Methanosarcinales archaeon]